MRIFFTLCFILVTHFLGAQEYIDAAYEKGFIKDGRRTGIWEFYDNDHELDLKIDFSNGRISYIKRDTAYFYLERNATWERQKLIFYPIYALGSRNLILELKKNIRFPQSALANGISGRVSIMFTVDTLGRAGNFEIIEKLGYGCDTEAMKGVQAIPNAWIPAIINGKKYPARFILPIVFVGGKVRRLTSKYKYEARVMKPVQIEPYAAQSYQVVEFKPFKTPTYIAEKKDLLIEEYGVIENTSVKDGRYISYKLLGSIVEIQERGAYKNGLKNGAWQEFYTCKNRPSLIRTFSNKVKGTGEYKNGVRNGIWTFYHVDNKPGVIDLSSDSDSVELAVGNPDIKPKSRGMYGEGKETGIWVEFDAKGDTTRVFDYTTHTLIMDKEFPHLKNFKSSPKALYKGGVNYLKLDLATNLNFAHVSQLSNKDSLYGLFLVPVDSMGRTSSPRFLRGNMNSLVYNEIKQAFSSCNEWIPAYQYTESVRSANVYAVKLVTKRFFERGGYENRTHKFEVMLLNHMTDQ